MFVELDQSPSLLVQAEDRAHRVGQAAHVHVYYLMAKGGWGAGGMAGVCLRVFA